MCENKQIIKRESNIELLRIIAILGVILLHFNNPQIGGGLKYVIRGSVNFWILNFLESIFVCSVNLFILISGYFMCQNLKRNLWKPLELIIQVVIFRVVIYLLQCAVGFSSFSINGFVGACLPANYFVILYAALYIISPFINIMMNSLKPEERTRLVVVLLMIFSVWATMVDLFNDLIGKTVNGLSSIGMYGSQWGYTIVNFVLMYILGAYLRINPGKNSSKKNFLILLSVVLSICIWAVIGKYSGLTLENSAWSYCNPLIILEAVLIFSIFKKINLGNIGWINKLAKGCFTVFLVHMSLIALIPIDKLVVDNPLIMTVLLLVLCCGIFLICWCVWWVYDKLITPLIKILQKHIKLPDIGFESR